MTSPKKLIEAAMPIREISAESVRDKSIRHGHISTLHLWWARRPLPVCRVVVFASLVPDPLDEHCPQAFRDAVRMLIGIKGEEGDPYKPYDDIPWTAAIDRMEDNLRNRLLMFIGKFSDTYIQNEKRGKTTPAKDLLSAFSLIKWDNKNDEAIINKARKLIWVAHNTRTGQTAEALMTEFDQHYNAIRQAEAALYATPDRHIVSAGVAAKEQALHNTIEAFLDRMPRVFDPFAGGGAIPLEAARLGCRSYGNDINPVAHIIQKGSLEFPQKFGKPIVYSKDEFIRLYGEETWKQQPPEHHAVLPGGSDGIRITNRLSFDVEYYARKLLVEAEKEIGYLYPPDEQGNKPIAYYWARVGTCSNPSCKAEVPLLKQFYLANTDKKHFYLSPIISDNQISFEIKQGKYNEDMLPGWNKRATIICPICGSITDTKTLKKQFVDRKTSYKMLCVIQEGSNGKEYRLPTKEEIEILAYTPEIEAPSELMPQNDSQNLKIPFWGYKSFGQMFSPRQLYALQAFVDKLNQLKTELAALGEEYQKAVVTYLGIWLDRVAVANTSFGVWHVGRETLERPMGRQAIPMVFDFPESNPFCAASGSALNQLDWISRYIESEGTVPFHTVCQNASSGEKSQFKEKYINIVVTDPPYYDAIAYADLSDFFYVWLKRSLGDVYPLNFATPQTPKTEECTALKHHHQNDKEKAKIHFENKLTQIFDAIEHQTSDIVSIMFAHQSTEAWTTLCNSILESRMNITGSWATDTEMTGALKTNKAFLSSSVTVCAKPAQRKGIGGYQEVKKAIEKTVGEEVANLYKLGFRGPDLLTACFGKAVSEFGKYEKVEKADGSEVTVAELLEMAKESAFNALLKGFDGDDFTRFYIAWLQLYGLTESDFDDAAKFSRVGLSIDVGDLFRDHILIRDKNKQVLGCFRQRTEASKSLGEKPGSHLIDQVHRAMALYEGKDRNALLRYLAGVAYSPDGSFWRVVTSLAEVLPAGSDDHTIAIQLLTNKDNLLRDSRDISQPAGQQTQLEF